MSAPAAAAHESVPPAEAAARPVGHAAFVTLGAGLGLGIAGDLLFRNAFPGINVAIWVLLLVYAAHMVSYRTGGALRWTDRWLVLAIGLASCLAIRDAEVLRVLNILGIGVALSLGGLAHYGNARTRPLRDYVATALRSAGHVPGGPALLLAQDADWQPVRERRLLSRAIPLVVGLGLAGMVLAVFGGLFASADPVFEALAEAALTWWDPGPLFNHIFVAGVFGWLSAGLMRTWLWQPSSLMTRTWIKPLALDPLPIGMAVGAMVLAFVLFVAVQARFLFGGDALVQTMTGLTYAEYARRGFFEMVTASALAIPVLYGADIALEGSKAGAVRNIRTLGLLQLALVGLTMASAFNRMRLYVDAYGLTTDRLMVGAIITWLACVGVWFGVTVLRGRRNRFTFGAVTSGFAVLAGLNAVNPDALIARVNSGRAAAGAALDQDYLKRLGADAVPVLAQRLPSLGRWEGCRMLNAVHERWSNEDRDWRGWNLAVTRARTAARQLAPDPSCPAADTTTSGSAAK